MESVLVAVGSVVNAEERGAPGCGREGDEVWGAVAGLD